MSTFSLKMDIVDNTHFTGQLSTLFNVKESSKALAFHQKIQGYQPTPLRALDALAKEIGVAKILVKDESKRFDLNAFKMLGGAYAIARLICQRLNLPIEQFDFAKLKQELVGKMTFISTTDGNHGRGVAWAAQKLGQKCIIYMPKGSAQERVDRIKALGAECYVTDMNYDDTVRMTSELATKNDWFMVQDTSWEGYTEIPTWIMQGYATMAMEAIDQIKQQASPVPTHVFLQAGVGAMAGGVLGVLSDYYGADKLNVTIVEPDKADCIYRSGKNPQGEPVNVTGEMATIMAGLACGEPCPLGWEVIKHCVRHFASCEDKVSALGMRVLGNPISCDERVISGESGAVGVGLLLAMAHHPKRDEWFDQLALNKDSVLLFFSTEGDTDKKHYQEVVWEGKWAANP